MGQTFCFGFSFLGHSRSTLQMWLQKGLVFIAHSELALPFSHTPKSLRGTTKSPQISWEDPEIDLGTCALMTLCLCQAQPSCLL